METEWPRGATAVVEMSAIREGRPLQFLRARKSPGRLPVENWLTNRVISPIVEHLAGIGSRIESCAASGAFPRGVSSFQVLWPRLRLSPFLAIPPGYVRMRRSELAVQPESVFRQVRSVSCEEIGVHE